MEAETGRQSHHQGLQQFTPSSPGIPGLDVVRALHQTVISLRSALDSSREELRRLKESVGDFSGENYVDAVERLTLENHILRRKILSENHQQILDDVTIGQPITAFTTDIENRSDPAPIGRMESRENNVRAEEPEARRTSVDGTTPRSSEAAAAAGSNYDGSSTAKSELLEKPQSESLGEQKETLEIDKDDSTGSGSKSRKQEFVSEDKWRETGESGTRVELEVEVQEVDDEVTTLVDHLDIPDKDMEELSLRSASDGENSVFSDNPEQQVQQQQQQNFLTVDHKVNDQSENESEELDDIELIFTTDDTCRELGLQEDLVSITETDNWSQNTPAQQISLLKYTKSVEGDALVCNGEKTNSVDEAASSQSSSIDREESVDRFDESSSTRLNKMWSQCSVLVETDISKCGVVEETEHSARHAHRRNTLAAPPTAYRPMMHREALAGGRRKSSAPLRPVMDRSCGARRESGAQTDISALPAQWRSESYLAHKVAHTFTTLPSKFALPAGVPGRLRLSDKTREARRVMLSDISFTSMVPELSRSADHLCHDPHVQSCVNSRGCGLRTPEVHRRESLGSHTYWPRNNLGTGLPSPCDCRLSSDLYSSRYRGSLSSIPSPGLEIGPPRRHSWRATAASFDTWRVPAPVTATKPRPTWSSMPSSPTHQHPPITAMKTSKNIPRRARSKITFQECPVSRGSVPNLRSDLVAGENSGGSTESLIDEAEDFLRRSIDSMLTESSMDYWNTQYALRRRRTRRHSEPNLVREWNPSQDARPYLPKKPGDLKIDHLVKVISPEGSVLQGRVRYVGPVLGREDVHVGVELPYENGSSDGTFHGRRFFDCEPDRAIFVPFKKVVLAWCTT